jgi:hypothetical protein
VLLQLASNASKSSFVLLIRALTLGNSTEHWLRVIPGAIY